MVKPIPASITGQEMTICLAPASSRAAFATAGIYIQGQPTRLTFISTSSPSWAFGPGMNLSTPPAAFIQTNHPIYA